MDNSLDGFWGGNACCASGLFTDHEVTQGVREREIAMEMEMEMGMGMGMKRKSMVGPAGRRMDYATSTGG